MRLLNLLKNCEQGTEMLCPICGDCITDPGDGHKEDCELKLAIDHFEKVAAVPEAERTMELVRFG